MDTKSALQDALHANDLDTIKASLLNTPLTARQNELDTSLILAMPQSSLETIELLLDLGAKLKEASLFSAVAREETAVFKLLIDAGWDINSTEFQRTAAQ
jgi:ankyrin repeat protein